MSAVPNRRARRAAMKSYGFFKMKNKLPLKKRFQMMDETARQGKEIFEANRDAVEKSIAAKLEEGEKSLIESWKDMGYNDTEIQMLCEANAILVVRDMETWKEDKKRARRLMKEALESKNNRTNL